MKKTGCLLLTILVSMTLVAVGYSETLVTYGGSFSEENIGFQTFLSDHPEVSLSWPDVVYYSSSAFTNALLTRDFNCDLFTWTTSQIDWQNLMDKGYCGDLSSSHILMEAVKKMHPNIARQAIHNGRLLAIPQRVNFVFLQIDEDTWFEAGLTLEDVPQSFPEFLNFLENWCDCIEESPEPTIRIIGSWDSVTYTEASYTSWLTRLLLNEVFLQMSYAGEELYFDDLELLALVKQCDAVGKRIYHLESRNDALSLFDEVARGTWPTNHANIVFLRQNDMQPKLMKAGVSMWAINSLSSNQELSIELLEKVTLSARQLNSYTALFLYSDAQAQINPDYETDVAYWTDEINTVLAQLQDPDLDGESKANFEEKLIRNERALELVERKKWILHPDQLADYQASVDMLYFPIPNIFDSSQSSVELERLLNQFGNHQLTAEDFLNKLSRIARMMRLED